MAQPKRRTKHPEWEIEDFSGGLNNKLDDNLLNNNQASDLQNVVCTTIGSLTSRKGQAKLNSTALPGPILGLSPYYLGSKKEILAASNGNIYKWTGSAMVGIKSGWDASAPVDFESLVNYAVAFNGVDTPVKYDGTNVSTLANAPIGNYPKLFKEKLFIVPASDKSQLNWSDSFAPETWPAVNYWDVKKGDGDEIKALFPYLRDLTVFKQYSIHVLSGTSIDDFTLNEADGKVGAVSNRAVTAHGNYLYFIGTDGIYRWNGFKAVNMTEGLIPKTWSAVNKEYLHLAAAGAWENYIWFAVPSGSTATTNNTILAFDVITESWWVFKGITPSCFCIFNDGSGQKLYSGHATNGYVMRQDVGNGDDGVAIDSYWIGRTFDGGDPMRRKKIKKFFIADGYETNDVSLSVSLDYEDFEALSLVSEEELLRRYGKTEDTAGYWRYLRPKFSYSTLNKSFEIRGVLMVYKIKSNPK